MKAATQSNHTPKGYLTFDSQGGSIVEIKRLERLKVMDWVNGDEI